MYIRAGGVQGPSYGTHKKKFSVVPPSLLLVAVGPRLSALLEISLRLSQRNKPASRECEEKIKEIAGPCSGDEGPE